MFWSTSKWISHVTQFSPFVPEAPRRLFNYMSPQSSCESARAFKVKTWPAVIISPPHWSPAVSVNHKLWCPDFPCRALSADLFLYTCMLQVQEVFASHATHIFYAVLSRSALRVVNFKWQRRWRGNLFTVAEGPSVQNEEQVFISN